MSKAEEARLEQNMTPEEIKTLLDLHAKWLRGESDGAYADLAEANLTDADLTGADLRGANLRVANMTDANLRGADLRGANLRSADLAGANLTDADLAGANLTLANMTGANLAGANLAVADLTGADLTDANLTGADLRFANLRGANLTGADLTGAVFTGIEIPQIPHIDAAILAEIDAVGGSLDMRDWHTCRTTHCRAGWAITLGGEAGRRLEKALGPSAAGALIYAVSRPDERVPDFHSGDDAAMADIQRCAEADPLPAE